MKRLIIPVVLAAAAVAVAAPIALAQKGPAAGGGLIGPTGGPFGILRFDANADGKVTRSELDAGQKSAFAGLDADRNGSVTREEMRTAMEARREVAQKARFTRMDTDGNGQLSEAEMKAARDDRHEGMRDGRGYGKGGGRHGGPGPRGAAGGPGADSPAIDFAAFSERGVKMFERLDADSNGTVTVKEMQALLPPV